MNLKKIKARDLMTEIVISIPQDTLIKDAAHLMLRDRISGLLVINAKKRIVGIITLTDFLSIIDHLTRADNDDFLANLLRCRTLKVSDVMTRNICTIPPETSLRDVIKTMVKKNIHTFPIMKGNKLLGILGRRDIINAVFAIADDGK